MKVYVVTYCENENGGRAINDVVGVFTDISQARKELEEKFHEACDRYGVTELNEHSYHDKDYFNLDDEDCTYEAFGSVEEKELITDDFPVTTVCRDDLESIGFDTTNVDDSTMEQLTSRMSEAYCDSGFWYDLRENADYLNIPRKEVQE